MHFKNMTPIGAIFAGALLYLSGCSADPPSGPAPPPPPPPPPASGEAQSLSLVSGDGQNGKTLTPLGEPLTVRALDAQGSGVAGISVSFAVTVGGGDISQASETTDADGLASVELRLGPALGPNAVTASVSGLEGSPVTFTSEATVLVIDVANFAFVAPDGSDAVLVAVGDTIEWVNRDNIPHTVTANLAPNGGVDLFDSGILALGDTFRFVPGETGVFEYLCQVHPTTMFGATITVQ